MLDTPDMSPLLTSFRTIQLLDEITLATGIQHLQIPQKIAALLKSFEIYTIGEFAQVSRGFLEGRPRSCGVECLDFYWPKIEFEIELRILDFAASIQNGKVNWVSFWETIDYEFTFAAARLDQIFDLDQNTKALQLDSLNFGKAFFYMHSDGIYTVEDLVRRLVEGLPDYTGFGKTKMRAFASGLRDFISTINCEGTRSSLTEKIEPSTIIPSYRGTLQFFAKNINKMSEKTANLTLEKLHLHKEIGKLNRIGINNLGQLLNFFAEGIPMIPGIGYKARTNLLNIATSVDSSIDQSGEIDWEVFAKMAGFSTIPSQQTPLSSGREFLASLNEVVQKLTTEYYDEMESATLVDRLIPIKKVTVTLEEMSRRFGVTRERIRQIQKEVIEQISAAVLDNNYQNLSFRFTQHFSEFWQAAAEHFSGTEEVTYNDFIEGLTIVWKVDRQEVMPHLPLIYAILTSNSTLPKQFNLPTRSPPKIFHISHPPDLKKSYKALHPSRFLVKIIDQSGIKSIEQLIDVLRKEVSVVAERTIYRLINEILDPLSSAVTSNGEIAWQKFYNIKGIKLLPDVDSDSPTTFINHVIETVSEFIRLTRISRRSCDIFRLRIVPESGNRKTLYETGKILECNGPQIKREENELIERLHDAIYADDFSNTSLCFRLSFINYWKRARKIYRQCSNLERFAYLLSLEWGLPITEVSKIIPMLVCVIDGRPKGYTGKRYLTQSLSGTSQPECSESTNDSVVIRLRGFRNIH